MINDLFSDVNFISSSVGNSDLIYGLDCIKSSIFTIVSTTKGNRLFRPDFGSNIENLLFDPMDDYTTFAIKEALIDSISKWEPRIVLDKVNSSVIPDFDSQVYVVNLIYSVPQLGINAENLKFNLSKGR